MYEAVSVVPVMTLRITQPMPHCCVRQIMSRPNTALRAQRSDVVFGNCIFIIIVMLLQVAAMLLKRYKDKFSGNPLGATWGYLRQMARDSLPPNPLVSHDTQPSHLRDPAFLVKTLR